VTIDPGHAVVLVLAGVAAGWINTIAGAGGVITIPALILWGLPAPVANGTNRVSVVAQCLVGTAGYMRAKKLPRAGLVATTLPAIAGALGGAVLATRLSARAVEIMVVATFAVVVVSTLYTPRAPDPDRARRTGTTAVLGMFLAGFYGGLVQTGVGLVLLAVLAGLIGHELVAANAIKTVVVLAFNIVALIVFAVAGQVDWLPGLLCAAGSMLGALLGVRFAVTAGHAALRIVVIAVTLGAATVVLLR
jgi:uncharacterized membrane protein YfcA